jgi:hypothetical protein
VSLIEYSNVSHQQLQAEKEEAWKAEQLNKSSAIQLAQKELEEVRNTFLFFYQTPEPDIRI